MPDGLPGPFRLGVILNPVAGMGGKLALHGTDGDAARLARERGAVPSAHLRMRRALLELRVRVRGEVDVLAAGGAMGADLLAELGWDVIETIPVADPSSARDTQHVARAMDGVDLVLFAGGDGTAADLATAVGTGTTLLGVPSGVKMHSGVFAVSPEAAGAAVAAFVDAGSRRTTMGEVVDVVAPDSAAPRLLGVASVPRVGRALQRAKSVATGPVPEEVAALGRAIAEGMEPGRAYVLGPGLSVAAITESLGLQACHRGFDVVVDRQLIIRDATEEQLHEVVRKDRPTTLVLGVIGGQGFLLGRGNQQASPRVLERVDDVVIVAARDKIEALDPMELQVDLGDELPDRVLAGYRRVFTGPRRSMMLRIANPTT